METLRPVAKALILPVLGLIIAVFLLRLQTASAVREGLFREREKRVLAGLERWQAEAAGKSFDRPESLLAGLDAPFLSGLSLKSARVLDGKGRILASTLPGEAGNADPDNNTLEMVAGGGSGFYTGKNGRDRGLIRSFERDGRPAGSVKFAFDPREVEEAARRAANRLSLAAFLFFTAVVFFLAVSIGRRERALRELERGVRLAGTGDFRFEIPVRAAGGEEGAAGRFNALLSFLKERDERRVLLNERLKTLAVSKGFSGLFDRITAMAREEIHAESAVVLVVRDDMLVVGAASGYPEGLVRRDESYPADEDVFTEIMEYGRPLIITDPSEIRRNARYAALVRSSGPVALFPVTQGEEIYGILHAGKAPGSPPFTPSEIEAGEACAGGAAVAMTHLVEESTEGEEAPPLPPPSAGPHKLLGIASFSAPGKGRTHIMEFGVRPDETTTLLFIRSPREVRIRRLDEKLGGAEGMAMKLRKRLNDLSFFALSVLPKLPASPQRDRFMKEFGENPFSPAGLCRLLEEVLDRSGHGIEVEAVAFDLKRKVCEPALNRLTAALLSPGGEFTPLSGPAPFAAGNTVLVFPKGAPLAPPDLASFSAPEAAPSILDKLVKRLGAAPDTAVAVVRHF